MRADGRIDKKFLLVQILWLYGVYMCTIGLEIFMLHFCTENFSYMNNPTVTLINMNTIVLEINACY